MGFTPEQEHWIRMTGQGAPPGDDFWNRLAARDPATLAGLHAHYLNVVAGFDPLGTNAANNAGSAQTANFLADFLGIRRPFPIGTPLASGTAYTLAAPSGYSGLSAVASPPPATSRPSTAVPLALAGLAALGGLLFLQRR